MTMLRTLVYDEGMCSFRLYRSESFLIQELVHTSVRPNGFFGCDRWPRLPKVQVVIICTNRTTNLMHQLLCVAINQIGSNLTSIYEALYVFSLCPHRRLKYNEGWPRSVHDTLASGRGFPCSRVWDVICERVRGASTTPRTMIRPRSS